ncbi:MAG: cellulase family glycosylhydrolase [Anaerolineae bacterium]|nr:cellulase family glycosylhydrolase [Anaerolineae bacterium]
MTPRRNPSSWTHGGGFLLLALGALLAAALLAGCGGNPTPTPTPTKTPKPPTETLAPFAKVATPTPVPPTDTPPPPSPTPAAGTSPTAPLADPTATFTAAPVAPAATPTPSPRPQEEPVRMRSPDYGVQVFLWWREEVADRDLQLARDAGFRWVKQLFSWQDIEGAAKGHYDWSRTDRIVDQVEQHGLKLIVRVSQDPDRPFWAGTPPDNAQDFADFLRALAARYRGRIHAYQVWNEPNLAREWGGKRPDPAGYARMLRLAYAAIKAQDPNAIVVTAGMAPTGTDSEIAMPDMKFYDLLYQAMGGNSDGYFDMLGVHAAGYAAPPELDPAEAAANKERYGGYRFFAFRHVEDVRDLMVRYGDRDKRVVILEFGWTTDDRPDSPYYWHGAGAGITEKVKADYLVRAYQYAAEHWTPWIGLMSVIYLPDVNWTENDEQYYWSIIGPGYPDLFLRESYVRLCIYLNELRGKTCKYAPQ